MSRHLDVLPHAEFTEHHERVIDAPADRAWSALHEVRWEDLRWTRPLMAVRTLGRPARIGSGAVLESGPTPTLHEEPGRYVVGGFVGRPWRPTGAMGPRVRDLAELEAFDEPGWLVCSMDFTATPLPDGRTRLETTTRCAPTDDSARRAFARYWRLIRPFSGLIRIELLRAVAARAERRMSA